MILITLITGLAGALLMFCGDMTLYYDKNDFKHDGTLDPIINIMKKLPPIRVMIGGWIGPVAAFLYLSGRRPPLLKWWVMTNSSQWGSNLPLR